MFDDFFKKCAKHREPVAIDPTDGLPEDLARVLRDQSITVPQDAKVFELIHKWQNAPSNTASADLSDSARFREASMAISSVKQHRIPDPPPIAGWQMTQGSPGASAYDLVGRTIVTSYEIPGEEDRGMLFLLDDGKVIGIGVDIGYTDDLVGRDPSKHEVYIYDATDTPAGEAIKKLEPGQWL